MNTVFVDIELSDGHTASINPDQIVAVEALREAPHDRCVVVTSAYSVAQPGGAGAPLQLMPVTYVVAEGRQALLERIMAVQHEARQALADTMNGPTGRHLS